MKLLKIAKKGMWLGLLITLITACQTTETTKEEKKRLGAITPPIPALAKAYTTFDIDPSEAQTLSMPSGTEITIPANAIVNEDGKVPSGTVQLKYREYHDAVDVLLSGIPMTYRAAGRSRIMQTAGMFDIAATQGDQALQIKEGEGIHVAMASFTEGDDFSFFALDETKGWEFLDYNKPTANPKRQKVQKEVRTIKRRLSRVRPTVFVFNYRAILDIHYNNKSEAISKNKNNPAAGNKAKRYDLTWMESSARRTIQYEGNYYNADMMVWKHASKKRMPRWLFKKKHKVTLTPKEGNFYTLEMTAANGKTFSTTIEALLPLKYVFEYSPKAWKNNFKKIMADVIKEEARLRKELEEARKRYERQAAMIRSFEIQGFGVYNYDKLMKEDDRIEVLAEFNLEDASQEVDWVICLPEDNRTVIKYPKFNWDKVNLLPNNAARFIALLPDGSLAVYSAEAYQKIDFDKLRQQTTKPEYHFDLKKVIDKVDSEAALREVVAMQ